VLLVLPLLSNYYEIIGGINTIFFESLEILYMMFDIE